MVPGKCHLPRKSGGRGPLSPACPGRSPEGGGSLGGPRGPSPRGTRGRQLRGHRPCRSRSPAAPRLALAAPLSPGGLPAPRSGQKVVKKTRDRRRGRPEVRVRASGVRVRFRAAAPLPVAEGLPLGDSRCTGVRMIRGRSRGATFLPSFLLLPA